MPSGRGGTRQRDSWRRRSMERRRTPEPESSPPERNPSFWRRWRVTLLGLLGTALTAATVGVMQDAADSALRNTWATVTGLFDTPGHEPPHSEPTASASPSSGVGPLVSVGVSPHLDDGCGTGRGWVFPTSPAGLAGYVPGSRPSRGGTTWDQDPYAFGGAAPGTLRLNLTVSGRDGHAIVVKAFTVRVIQRAKAGQGTVLDPSGPGQGCGGGGVGGESLTLWYGKKDLDASPPRWVTGTDGPRDVRAVSFPYKVTAAAPAEFQIDVSTQHCDCTWVGRLEWSDGATSGTTTITDKGRPFRTAPATGLPRYKWSGSAWRNCRDNGCY
ncbi:hypothetical protein [Streptomyces sp. NPDC054834]